MMTLTTSGIVKALKAMHKDEPEETTEEKMKRISEAVKSIRKTLKRPIKFSLESIMLSQSLLTKLAAA